jgi:hypothetical protein
MTKPTVALCVLALIAVALLVYATWAICCAAGLGERARGRK